MTNVMTADAYVPQYLINQRRDLCAAVERAESGHPKPEMAKEANARLDAFDRKHPQVRNAR